MKAALRESSELIYQKFNLKECESQLQLFCREKDIDGVAYANYFILTKTALEKDELVLVDDLYCYRVKKTACKFASCELLNKHNLTIGSYEGSIVSVTADADYFVYLNEFKNLLIDVQLFWALEFLKMVKEHLKNRRVTRLFATNESLQSMLDDVVERIVAAEKCRALTDDLFLPTIFEQQALAVKELRSASQILAKLYGGRSFLSGSVVEMMMIFEYFRDIYFS